jgi:hypothetical protein
MDIGKPKRIYRIEPLAPPVPAKRQPEREANPAKTKKIPACSR